MDETLDYWQEKLAEYQEAYAAEMEMEEKNQDMIKLLKFSILSCEEHIGALS